MGEQIVCSNCLSNADSGLPACPYCGQSFENTNPAGTLPVNTLLAGRYTIGRVLALDGEGVLYAAIDNSATRRVVIKEYVPVTICAARSRDGSVIPRQGREVLFKTTRMDFVDLYRSLVALGRNDGLVQVLDLIEENNTAYAVREPDEGAPLSRYLAGREEPLTQEEALVLLRPVFVKYRDRGKQEEPTHVGQTAVVVEDVDNEGLTGRVETDNRMTWAARSADGSFIPQGAVVRIVGQESVKLIVERKVS